MTATYKIFVKADQTFRLTLAGTALAGETEVTLSSEQLAALNALRVSHPGSPFAFNGTTFVLSQGETIRLALLAILTAQAAGVQTFFAGPAAEVKTLLQAGQIAAAREIIATIPLFGDTGLTSVQTTMLAAFPS